MRLNQAGIAVMASSLAALAWSGAGGIGGPAYEKNPGLPRNRPPERGVPVLTGKAPEELSPDNRAARRRRFKARKRVDERAAMAERARALSALKERQA